MCASLFFFSLVVGVLVLVFGLQSMLRFDPEKKRSLYSLDENKNVCEQTTNGTFIDRQQEKKEIYYDTTSNCSK